MIKPVDVKATNFKKGLFGYKAADVDAYVDTVYRAYDEVYKENTELSDNLEKINAALQEARLKIFELENEIQKTENVPSSEEAEKEAKKKADAIIKNAEATAAEIIAKAKEESSKIEASAKSEAPKAKVEPVSEPKTEPKAEESASSKFFHKSEDTASSAANEDDDEIFVGEIEDARKPDRMMIGDGEEEADMDFEFL